MIREKTLDSGTIIVVVLLGRFTLANLPAPYLHHHLNQNVRISPMVSSGSIHLFFSNACIHRKRRNSALTVEVID